ncbi:MAG: radical SAM protein [Thermodesulfobacteriota bacterium]|nr:radical SAM protein [Thermodesulfobacteriota bacterium]
MRFLLVDPPHKIWTILRAWVPSPGCLQLLAYLERESFDIDYMDCTVNENPWRDLEERIRREKPEVVGISVICTAFIYDGMNAANLIKAISPKTVIIMGGEHPSFTAEETLRDCPAIDYICVGEGEVTLTEFLRAIEKKEDLSRVLGLAFLDEKGIFIYTGDRPFIEDLDTLPLPAYHLARMEHPYVGIPSEGNRGLVVNFSRGCTFDCSFCSESAFYKRKWRRRNPKLIADELQLLKEKYNRDIFYVGDNTFNVTRDQGIGFIEEMLKRKTNQRFWLQSRADLIIRDEDLLDGFREAGVYQFMLGLEYHTDSVLRDIRKRHSVDEAVKAMQLVKEHKLMVMATLLIGHWEETEEDRDAFLTFFGKYVDHFGLNLITPLPGTPFFNKMKEMGRIKDWEYRNFDYLHAVMPTREVDDLEQLNFIYKNIMRRYYWRPRELIKLFSRNPILGHHHRFYITKVAVNIMMHEIFGNPMWVQPNYQEYRDYLVERDEALPTGLMRLAR